MTLKDRIWCGGGESKIQNELQVVAKHTAKRSVKTRLSITFATKMSRRHRTVIFLYGVTKIAPIYT